MPVAVLDARTDKHTQNLKALSPGSWCMQICEEEEGEQNLIALENGFPD